MKFYVLRLVDCLRNAVRQTNQPKYIIVVYLTSSHVICFKGPRVPKKAQITQERVEYNVFLFNESPKGSKSLKIFKISLTLRFDKLSNLSKSVHTGENSQILTVSNKKNYFYCLKFSSGDIYINLKKKQFFFCLGRSPDFRNNKFYPLDYNI
jgi:hypothetical protein